jgi:hypothetical protein
MTSDRQTTVQTSFSSREIQDLLVQHENNLREKGLLVQRSAVPSSGEQQEAENQDLDMDYYVDVYFSHFNHQWPVLHRLSFQLSTEPQILLLAVVMIGLWVTGGSAAQSRAETMHEKLLTLLESRMVSGRVFVFACEC